MISVTLVSSDFGTTSNHPLGEVHLASRWQVDILAGDFSAPVVDSGWDTVNKLSFTTAAVLDPGAAYKARVAHRDSLEIDGDFSDFIVITFGASLPHPSGIYFGSVDKILQVDSSTQDNAVNVVASVRTNAVAPENYGGECLFTAIFLAVEYTASGTLTVTPILDGQLITSEAKTINLTQSSTEVIDRFQISLSIPNTQTTEKGRNGMRGTYFAVKVDALQTSEGFINISGCDLEYDPVRESQPGIVYTAETLQANSLAPALDAFFGQIDSVYLFEGSDQDAGTTFKALAEANSIAPAGVGGECIFTQISLVLTHDNTSDILLKVIPILDGVEQTAISITAKGTSGDTITEVIEIPLSIKLVQSSVEVARFAMRGTWFTARVETDGTLPDGRFVIEGMDLEFDVVYESEIPV